MCNLFSHVWGGGGEIIFACPTNFLHSVCFLMTILLLDFIASHD